jgi:citrate lyase subunit beta/citryl-CoA lyase
MTQLLRRSELAVPASNDDMFAKAARTGADLIFLDLEDAVAAGVKEDARDKAIIALNDIEWGAPHAQSASTVSTPSGATTTSSKW